MNKQLPKLTVEQIIEKFVKPSTNRKIIYPATDYTLVAVCSLAFLLIIILAI